VSKVYNDLLLVADEGQVSAVCPLDLTAALQWTPLTTTYYYHVLSVSLDYVVQFCSGSDLIYLAGHSGFCAEAPCRLLFTSCALFHKDQNWVHGCLFYTPQT